MILGDWTRRSLASGLICAFPALAAAGACAGDGDAGAAGAYASRAGAVLGTYRPAPPDRSPEATARAATRFLGSLNTAQRRAARHDLTSPERRSWTNAPVRGQVGGVALGDLDDDQLRAFSDLLAALLSAKGNAFPSARSTASTNSCPGTVRRPKIGKQKTDLAGSVRPDAYRETRD